MKRMGIMILALGFCLFAQVAQADWTSARRLTWTSGYSGPPAMAFDSSGNPHVVWEDDSLPDDEQIYGKNSADGGTTWATTQRLTAFLAWCTEPAIAIDTQGNLHMVFDSPESTMHSEIYYKKSTDGGATWTSAQRLTWTSGHSYSSAMAVDSFGNLHIVWSDDTPSLFAEIYYKKGTDGGTAWTPAQRLTATSGNSLDPAIAVDSTGNLHVVFSDGTSGPPEIYYKKSADGGTTWTSAQRLTWTWNGGSRLPAIAVDSSGNPYVVWSNNAPGNNEIYYKKSTDGGTTWTSAQRLTGTSGESYSPVITIDSSGNPHVVFYDNTPGNDEIYYKESKDGGASWTSAQRLISTSGSSKYPAIAIDPFGNLHIVWQDDTPGNYEIYYKKGT